MNLRTSVTASLVGSVMTAILMAQAPPATTGVNAPGGRGVISGGRANGFPQYTRPLAPQDVLVRGKSLYDANCASCHAADLRGDLQRKGPNLLRSADTMRDKQGELVAAKAAAHTPPINLPQTDTQAIAEYIHSIQATMSAQGSPPGRNPVGLTYDVLIGDAKAGQSAFTKLCSSCHSVTGDLKGIASKYDDPKTLQNTWVSGGTGGRGGIGGARQTTVTLANGQKIEGTLVRQDDFVVILTLADRSRRTIPIDNGVKVDVKDPQEAHKKMVRLMDDPEDKNMHDITAYLATIK
jgi:cytochrome c oxidase cbb3-type subunit III